MTDIDVLIVNFLSGDLTWQAVAHVSGPGVRVLVHDNSGELLGADLPGAEVHGDGSNVWFAHGNNVLFEKSRGELVLLLNPDVVLEHADLCRLADRLAEEPTAWGIVPRLLSPSGIDEPYVRRLPTLPALLADRVPPLRVLWGRAYRRYYGQDVDPADRATAEQPAAACLLLRRSRLDAVLFDERYRLFFNDTDLARRLNATGYCLVEASVTAVHVGGASIARARRLDPTPMRLEYDRALLRYALRNVRGGWLLAPIIGLRLVAHHLLGAAPSLVRRSRSAGTPDPGR